MYVSFYYSSIFSYKNKTHLENKCLIEDRVQCFFVHFGVKLLLLVREEQDFNIRVRGSTWVHGHEICSLKDTNCQLCGENERVCKQQEQWKQNFIRQKCNFSLRVTASDWLYKPRNPSPQASQLTGDKLNVRSFSSVSSNCHSVVTSKKNQNVLHCVLENTDFSCLYLTDTFKVQPFHPLLCFISSELLAFWLSTWRFARMLSTN